MSNPVFSSSPVFGERRRGAAPVAYAPNAYGTAGGVAADPAALEQMYGAPAATTRDTGRLTYDDVIVKTGGLLLLLIVVAAATWQIEPRIWPIGMVVGLVLGLVNSFKREPSPALIIAYTVAEGVFLGGVSMFFQRMTIDGATGTAEPIVLQAILGTFATFGAALFLYKSGRVRVTAKSTRFFLIALTGYAVFSLLNFGLSFFMASDGFGPLRNGAIGIGVGLLAVGLAAYSLIVDFDAVERGVRQGVPAKFAWSAAFGLVVTLVWLYLEILRLLAMLNRN